MRESQGKKAAGGARQGLSFRGEMHADLRAQTLKPGGLAEEGGEGVWYPEQRTCEAASGRATGIARQPLSPREARMHPLRPRERHGCEGSGGWESRLYLDL